MKKRIVFTVSMVWPPEATVDNCRGYIEEAVATWRGQLRPPGAYGDNDLGDPMWMLDPYTVKVRRKTE